MSESPLTVRDIVTHLEGFDPDTPVRLETYIEGRGCWLTHIADFVKQPSGSPTLIAGVTADQWSTRLSELRLKLENQQKKE